MRGRAILNINDHPDVRLCFSAFHTESLDINYTVGGGGNPAARKDRASSPTSQSTMRDTRPVAGGCSARARKDGRRRGRSLQEHWSGSAPSCCFVMHRFEGQIWLLDCSTETRAFLPQRCADWEILLCMGRRDTATYRSRLLGRSIVRMIVLWIDRSLRSTCKKAKTWKFVN